MDNIWEGTKLHRYTTRERPVVLQVSGLSTINFLRRYIPNRLRAYINVLVRVDMRFKILEGIIPYV